MKKIFTKQTVLALSLFISTLGFSQNSNHVAGKPTSKRYKQTSTASTASQELNIALSLAKQGKYEAASTRLFNMTRNPRFEKDKIRIKYILGLIFYEMKMYQVSAFQFVDVVRSGDPRYVKQALRKLSLAADILNDDTLINYAIGKINIDDFPRENQDMLRFRIGQVLTRKGDWQAAAESFSKVPETSPYYANAKYMEGLSLAKKNDLNNALKAFATLADYRKDAGPTDEDRVSALMGMARVYYQGHKWDAAIDMYREIPRDTEAWHESLFELAWAHMRAAQFRSVLSVLQSLHSPYYEDFYIPESILLRGIVYLYICQYDEMEKTLGLFERIYQPVLNKLENFTNSVNDTTQYFSEMERVIKNYDKYKVNSKDRVSLKIPFLVAREIRREGDFEHLYTYINRLRDENRVINSMPTYWKISPVGTYAKALIRGRYQTSVKVIGGIVRTHMLAMKKDLSDMFEQYNFAKYEMLNGKKEALKRKIQGKGVVTAHIDDSKSRSYYIQNGFDYYKFTGEYWLDEIGDYHYVGTQGCE